MNSYTPEELRELAEYDREIDDNFDGLTAEESARAEMIDRASIDPDRETAEETRTRIKREQGRLYYMRKKNSGADSYYSTHREACLARAAEYQRTHKEEIRVKKHEHYLKNRQRYLDAARRNYQKRKEKSRAISTRTGQDETTSDD